ncbi:MAG: tetratricopeptide (TPR) repeat protein [Enterobacterales bacterium]|jgi:tetratricopeptide (TPR) repeat protein
MTVNQTTSSKNQKKKPSKKTHPQIDESSLGFLSKLAYRRVPQAIGFYLAGSWTFLEFFESQISRYNISPHWQDVSLLVIVLLFPSILILAYRHGAPGEQPWTSVEKIGIPTNFLITFLIIVSQFATKDLGTNSEKVYGLGPDGSMIELRRPKAEFRKRLSIGYFTINDENSDKYLALGIPVALRYDLEQDPYLNVFDPTNVASEIKQSNFRGLNAPMALLLKIAKDNRIEYLVTGSLETKQERIVLKSALYNVNDGKLIKKLKTTHHGNVFDAIDDMSVQIKSAMGFSGGHINNFSDLPIPEQLTSSMPAFIAFTKSQHDRAFNDDFVSQENELKAAIQLDESFAAASSQYAIMLLQQRRTPEGLEMLQLAKKHNYRLTDSDKFSLAAIEALFRATPNIARSVVEQWIDLYPEDADAWQMKYILHRNFDERLLAIETLERIIELEPYGTHRHLTIGEIYTSLGDIESALVEYQKFISANPTNARGHLLIGDTKRTLGIFDSAKEEYQQAKLLLTNDLTADRRLADLLLREGKFDNSETNIKDYLAASKLPEDQYNSWLEIAELYWLRGQREASLSAMRNSFEALKVFQPETSYLLTRVQFSWRFAASGAVEEGQKMIDDTKLLMDVSKGKLYQSSINIAQAMFDAQLGKTDDSLSLIDNVSDLFKTFVGSGIDAQISMFKGITFYLAKDYQKASENMAAYIEKNPLDDINMMFILADSLFESGELSLAKDTFEKILIQFPAHPDANYGMAKIARSQEDLEGAMSYLNKALLGWAKADTNYEPAIEARKMSAQLTTKLESI